MPELFANPALEAGFAVTVVFTPICLVVTGLRFWSARLTKRGVGMEDWFALAAMVWFLLWVLFLTMMASSSRKESDQTTPTYDEMIFTNKLLFVGSQMFPLNQLCAKLSILFLCYRIFGLINNYAFWIKAVGVFHIIYTIETVFVNIFQCVPVSRFWDPRIPGHCINYLVFMGVNETFNSLIDFIMAIQAVIMLRVLQTSQKTRWRLSFVFVLGGVAGVIGFIKIGFSVASGIAVGKQDSAGVWATVQMQLSIICCCVITFKPLLAKLGGFASNLTSRATSMLRWRRTGEPSQATMNQDSKAVTWVKMGDKSEGFFHTKRTVETLDLPIQGAKLREEV